MAQAIILKNLSPQTTKVYLLDRDAGKKLVVPNRSDLAPGTVITYTPRVERRMCFVHTIELVGQPKTVSFEELQFVHHVLELTFYFAPLEQPVQGLYDLLLLLYRQPYLLGVDAYKKVFLAHFFIVVGMWPHDQQLQLFFSQQFVLKPVDMACSKAVHLMHAVALDEWLRECIAQHPAHGQFKTLGFWK